MYQIVLKCIYQQPEMGTNALSSKLQILVYLYVVYLKNYICSLTPYVAYSDFVTIKWIKSVAD